MTETSTNSSATEPLNERPSLIVVEGDQENAIFRHLTRTKRLAKGFRNREFRHSYIARQLKLVLAEQIRALRGDLTQKQFGGKIGKPQSVISRIEKQADKNISI